MATNSGLFGPHPLTADGICNAVRGVGPGTYTLGVTKDRVFHIRYTGRSDTDLADRLNDWVGAYSEFKYGFFDNAAAAYVKECTIFHEFSPPDNDIHPARPGGSQAKCPVCGF